MFYIILTLIPVFLLIILEISLRIFGYGYNLNLFEGNSNGFVGMNKNVGRRFFSKLDNSKPCNDMFLAKKPDSCFRVFVMGSSTVVGFPYDIGVSFPRVLSSQLQDAFPHKRVEVINTSMTAVNSYTLLDFIDEILKQKPDAILIYAGHNEYYGALGIGSVENGGNKRWLKLLHLKLIKFRLYQLIEKIIYKYNSSGNNTKRSSTLMERIVKEKTIPYGSELYYSGIRQYHDNMDELLKKTKLAGVPVIISELVSNIHDMKPFNSIETKGFLTAEEEYEKACKLETEGQYDKAREAYYLAKDLDAIRFRASEDINNIIHELADKYSVYAIPMKQIFERHSKNSFIGNNLMIEHLHPNIDGYFLIADAFFNAMRKTKLISDKWDTALIKPINYYRYNWGFTELDSLISVLRIKKLEAGWPFQPDSVVNRFKFEYKPVSMIDSLAFLNIKFNDVTVENLHKQLAKYYTAKMEYYKAYKEYYSIIKCYPFQTGLYYLASNRLLAAREYEKAFELMKSMQGADTSYSALFQIGIINFLKEDYKTALFFFERAKYFQNKAENILPLLVAMYKTYSIVGNKEKTIEIANTISGIYPNFNLSKASVPKTGIIILSDNVKKYISQAKKSVNEGNLDKALDYLYMANKIDDNPNINLLIGNILYQKRDTLALYYLEKANSEIPDDSTVVEKLCIMYIAKHDLNKASKTLSNYKSISDNQVKIKKLSALFTHIKRK